jgi:hypothetical protein
MKSSDSVRNAESAKPLPAKPPADALEDVV